MIRSAERAIEQAVQRYRGGQTLVVLADYDGTLAPIVEDPERAGLGDAERMVLRELTELPRVTVGILSGRTLADIRRMVRVRGLYFAGTGGMEVDLRGRRVHHPRAREAAILMSAVARELKSVVGEETGARIEQKLYGVTIHYRDVPEDALGDLLDSIEVTLQPWASRIVSYTGPRAEEVLPSHGWTKGSAVGLILDHVGRHNCYPIFFGDDANDADAFAVVHAAGGVAIGVGHRAPGATAFVLSGPPAVMEYLSALRDAIGAECGQAASTPDPH